MSRSTSEQGAHLALRIGLAFAFLYPPYAALSDPVSWASYFPGFVRTLPVDTTTLLHAFGVGEVVIALWLLSGIRIRAAAIAAAFALLAIVAFNLPDFEVLFRDLSIAAMAVALALWPKPTQRQSIV